VHDEGSGNYNALSVKATRRFSAGFNLIGSYTYGKSLDDTSGVRVQGNDVLFPQDNRCLRCDYGPSAFDVKNRIVTSALYELSSIISKRLKMDICRYRAARYHPRRRARSSVDHRLEV